MNDLLLYEKFKAAMETVIKDGYGKVTLEINIQNHKPQTYAISAQNTFKATSITEKLAEEVEIDVRKFYKGIEL